MIAGCTDEAVNKPLIAGIISRPKASMSSTVGRPNPGWQAQARVCARVVTHLEDSQVRLDFDPPHATQQHSHPVVAFPRMYQRGTLHHRHINVALHLCEPWFRLQLLRLCHLPTLRHLNAMKDATLAQARRAMDDATQKWNDMKLQFGRAEHPLLQAASEVICHSQHPLGNAASSLRCLSAVPDPWFRNAPFAKMQFQGGRPEPAPAEPTAVAEPTVPAVLEDQASSSSVGFAAPPIRAVSSTSLHMLSEVRARRSFVLVPSHAYVSSFLTQAVACDDPEASRLKQLKTAF
jgi:hypothetical protein